MSQTQKIIKYLAIAFAISLIVSIISAIMSAILFFGNAFDSDSNITNLQGLDISGDVSVLDLDLKSLNLVIKEGDILSAETNNKNIDVDQNGNQLFITQKGNNWFNSNKGDLIIYVPSDFVFDGVSINTGAGKLDISSLTSKQFYLELGAGKATISKLVVESSAKIEGGAGKITIEDSSINNLDLDIGVGKVSINSLITGKSEVDSGVGQVDLNLIGSSTDYKIKIDKGLGSSTISGKDMKENKYYGTGNNIIDIEGGVGSIKIQFSE